MKYSVKHLLDENEKVSNFDTDESFMAFVEKIKKENEDFDITINDVNGSGYYIDTYCGNLQLTRH